MRIHRQLFEAKQKTIVLKATMVKHKLRDNQKSQHEANKSLYQSLKCCSSIISSYLSHLPLSGGHLFPSSFTNLFDILREAGYFAKDLNFKKASQMISDTHRLSAVFNQFQPKFKKEDKDENASKSPASKMFGSTNNLKIINSLAEERFGAPPPALNLLSLRSPRRKSNRKRDSMMRPSENVISPRTFSGLKVKPKEIIPKPTKLLQDRVKFSKQKRYGDLLDIDVCNEDGQSDNDYTDIYGEDEMIAQHENSQNRSHTRESFVSNECGDMEENLLSIRSPRPPLGDGRKQSLASNDSHNMINKATKDPKMSRQSTISKNDDEDVLPFAERKNKATVQKSAELQYDLPVEDTMIRNQIKEAGFGNMLSFASKDKLRALNRFSKTPIINDNVVKGNYHSTGEGKRFLQITKDELEHIIRHKEQFEQDMAYSYFSKRMANSKYNLRNEHPYKLIGSITQQVTDEIIGNVCKEMLASDIVDDLIEKELQTKT